MPMIDVYAPTDLLPIGSDRRIGEELTRAVLRAEVSVLPARFTWRTPPRSFTGWIRRRFRPRPRHSHAQFACKSLLRQPG